MDNRNRTVTISARRGAIRGVEKSWKAIFPSDKIKNVVICTIEPNEKDYGLTIVAHPG